MSVNLLEMNAIVDADLTRIPTFPKPQQSFLRMTYALRRKNSLGRKAASPGMSRSEVLKLSIADLTAYQGFSKSDFTFDPAYFPEA